MKSLLIVIASLGLIERDAAQTQPYRDPDLCPGVWYTSEKAEGAEANSCLAELQKKTGTIKVSLKSPYARLVEGVVYVVDVQGKKFQLPWKNPVVDQKNLIFIPHVRGILVGSTVDFPNSDTVRHNVYSTPDSPTVLNHGTYPPEEVKHVT